MSESISMSQNGPISGHGAPARTWDWLDEQVLEPVSARDPLQLRSRALEELRGRATELGAVTAILDDRSADDAMRAKQRILDGSTGPLVGIPYAAKDIIAAQGGPTSWGVPAFRDRVLDGDAACVQRLAAAGAVLVTKVATTTLAGGGGHQIAGISTHGQPNNPWRPGHFAGSSSSGSAIVVALGCVPFALGSETGGSVVQPAAFCGVTGFRPTFGRISRDGVMTLSASLDKVGVLARTARTCAAVFDALDAGPDDGRREPGSLTLGHSSTELAGVAPALWEPYRSALDTLAALGHRLVPAEIDPRPPYGDSIEAMVAIEGAAEHEELIRDPSFALPDPTQLGRLRDALARPGVELARAWRTKEAAVREWDRVFRTVDLVVGLSIPYQPQRLDEPRPPRGSSRNAERVLAAANLAGVPGVSVPIGLDADGFPVGLHIVGPAGSDRRVLALAAAFQEATDHHRLRPPTSEGRAA